MEALTLVIGDKNYSSWSLRPWLLLRYFQIPFDEILIPLRQPQTREQLLRHSPTARVPALKHGDLGIWESLAICEYLAELFPEKAMWPGDRSARAVARSVANEMHAGFQALRTHFPMNIRARLRRAPTPEVSADIARILELWGDCRARFGKGGPFLFGAFSIADAMYAPVICRLQTYEIELDHEPANYARAILQLPALQEWIAAAEKESSRLD
ncbi:MAG: glutathione S-transferase family protein [Leptospirales bacterium]|nr:glutathione S-transferase family protein [Leptospirales bacterium]